MDEFRKRTSARLFHCGDLEVSVSVWDWGDGELAVAEDALLAIVAYFGAALRCGLTGTEIEDDIVAMHGALFEDAHLDFGEEGVSLVLVPRYDGF